MTVLLLMLAGCSRDDDYCVASEVYPIYGYWEYIPVKYPYDGDLRIGLLINPNGIVKQWEITFDPKAKHRYTESKWGKLTLASDGILYVESDFDKNIVDGYCYAVKEVSEDRLVIRVFGGYAGLSFEEGFDENYKKLESKPTE